MPIDPAPVSPAASCGGCGEPAAPGNPSCAACGRPLAPPDPANHPREPCTACGSGSLGSDGHCDECGHRPAGTEHAEEVLDPPTDGTGAVVLGAGVTDRGHRRRRNEDAFALVRTVRPDGTAAVVAVVCDGVASVPGGATASRTACDVAVAAGQEALAGGEDLDDAAASAADAARRAVAALAPGADAAPACTYVAAVLDTDRAVVSWIGDSRAYWLCPPSPEDSIVLTEDDSWAAEMVATGVVGPQDALSDPRAHVITRWLAADAPDVVARHRSWSLDDTGVLLLCSDGVWNDLPEPAVLAGVLAPARIPHRAVHDGVRALVAAALAEGGRDNATAILLALVPDGGG